MTTDTINDVEHRLVAGYRRQADTYERALRILDERATPADALVAVDWAPELRDTLQVVADLDAELADDKQTWRHTARVPGPELRTLLKRLANQIRELTTKIDGEIAALVARKERLAPEIDVFLRQRSMLNAYNQQSRTAVE